MQDTCLEIVADQCCVDVGVRTRGTINDMNEYTKVKDYRELKRSAEDRNCWT